MSNDQTAAAGVTLQVVRTAQLAIPQGYVFRAPGSRLAQLRAGMKRTANTVRSPCLAFVLRHPSVGIILVDTGFHPGAPRRACARTSAWP